MAIFLSTLGIVHTRRETQKYSTKNTFPHYGRHHCPYELSREKRPVETEWLSIYGTNMDIIAIIINLIIITINLIELGQVCRNGMVQHCC